MANEKLIALADKLTHIWCGDHERGCAGRQYECTCGYDETSWAIAEEVAAALRAIATPSEGSDHG